MRTTDETPRLRCGVPFPTVGGGEWLETGVRSAEDGFAVCAEHVDRVIDAVTDDGEPLELSGVER